MKAKIRPHATYKGKVSYRHPERIKPHAPKNGSIVVGVASWEIKEEDLNGEYLGEWAILLTDGSCWLPSGDINPISEIKYEEYLDMKDKSPFPLVKDYSKEEMYYELRQGPRGWLIALAYLKAKGIPVDDLEEQAVAFNKLIERSKPGENVEEIKRMEKEVFGGKFPTKDSIGFEITLRVVKYFEGIEKE